MESNIANSELPISIHDCGLEDNFKYNDFIVPELKSEQIIIPDVGNAIPVDLVLESLFGNNNIDFPRLDFLRNGFSLNYNGKSYFVVKEIERFIKFMANSKNFDYKEISNICPVNFYLLNGIFDNTELPYYDLFSRLFDFRNYLIKNNFSELLSLYWPKFFKGKVTAFIKDPYMLVLVFSRPAGKSLRLNVIEINNELKFLVESNTTTILENPELICNHTLYQDIVNEWYYNIEMDNGDEFIINNLAEVTGSVEMARFIFQSSKYENEHVIRISDINSIISFKSPKFKREYYDYFKEIYPDLVVDDNDYLGLLNFEGFNKYLLNLNPSHLASFSEKEMINEMYNSITRELITCYKKLYNYHKLA